MSARSKAEILPLREGGAAADLAVERSPFVGIGVGMTVDYGAAQRMYVLRGYVPDDGRVLFFTKRFGA